MHDARLERDLFTIAAIEIPTPMYNVSAIKLTIRNLAFDRVQS
jgi:hypothetical protein